MDEFLNFRESFEDVFLFHRLKFIIGIVLVNVLFLVLEWNLLIGFISLNGIVFAVYLLFVLVFVYIAEYQEA